MTSKPNITIYNQLPWAKPLLTISLAYLPITPLVLSNKDSIIIVVENMAGITPAILIFNGIYSLELEEMEPLNR